MARFNRNREINRPPVTITNRKSKLHLWMVVNSLMILGIYVILAKMNGWI